MSTMKADYLHGAEVATAVFSALRAHNLLALLDEICHHRGVLVHEVCGESRKQSVSWARQELWFQIRNHPDRHYSYAEIARLFHRDHTTVRHGIQTHIRRIRDDSSQAA
jgi:chromosomal replication initiation ATPase DnaA